MIRLSNRDARRFWLATNGLVRPQTGPPDVLALIRSLGFVQIDSIRNVTRAHHHILWSRNMRYRENMLWPLLSRNRVLFEHFTHDASLIPMQFLPMWQRQFTRLGKQAENSSWLNCNLSVSERQAIIDRIAYEGPLSTSDFESGKKSDAMWARAPHKKALDQMWYAGMLATARRENFMKFYDLADRIFPAHLRTGPQDNAQIDWLCCQALARLGFATTTEIKQFWDAVSSTEARNWVATQADLIPVDIETATGDYYRTHALPDLTERLQNMPEPSSRIRLLNPFDPAIRDRKRLKKLFGFDYRNEIFVPKNQRKYGYYVYPLLEGDRFVGRCELKANRQKGWLKVTGFWSEPDIRWTSARWQRFKTELQRFARLGLVTLVEFNYSDYE